VRSELPATGPASPERRIGKPIEELQGLQCQENVFLIVAPGTCRRIGEELIAAPDVRLRWRQDSGVHAARLCQ
jgi:hypothetical protein